MKVAPNYGRIITSAEESVKVAMDYKNIFSSNEYLIVLLDKYMMAHAVVTMSETIPEMLAKEIAANVKNAKASACILYHTCKESKTFPATEDLCLAELTRGMLHNINASLIDMIEVFGNQCFSFAKADVVGGVFEFTDCTQKKV